MRRTLAVLAVVAVGLGLAACGLPKDDGPRPLAKEAIPFDLLAVSTTAPPVTNSGRVEATLYFLAGDRLQKVTRQLETRAADVVLAALLAGVLAEDGDVRSAIPAGTRLLSTRQEERVLIIELTPEILGQQGQEQKNAFAQMVFTASEVETVFGVRFVVDGQFVNVPTDTGASDQAVYPIDFDSVKPEG